MTSQTDAHITLAPVMDLAAAGSLKTDLLAALAASGAVRIDGAAVSRISSPCLQVLAAAMRQGAVLATASDALAQTARTLDLTEALGLQDHV